MTPWVERASIDIDLSLPLAKCFDAVPADALAQGKRLLDAVLHEIPSAARLLAYGIRLRTGDRFQREAAAVAKLVSAKWQDVLLANISYDLMLSAFGCSTVALPTPQGPVLARNMDWWPEALLAQASYLIRYGKHNKLAFVNAGFPGAIGVVSGMSANGFAVVLNAVIDEEGTDKGGYPVLLHLRRVVEDAADFDAALAMLATQRLAAPALFTLVGVDNRQRVVVERSCRRSELRWPHAEEPLVATNDYRALAAPTTSDVNEIYQTTCSRYDSLCSTFASHTPDQAISDAALLYALTDPQVIQGITAQHIIFRPRTQQARLFVPARLLAAVE